MSIDIHQHRGTIQVGVDVINLRERAGEIVGEDLIVDVDRSPSLFGFHAPSLFISFDPWHWVIVRTLSGKLLDILGKIINRVPPRSPGRQNEFEMVRCYLAGDNIDGNPMRCWPVHMHRVCELKRPRNGLLSSPKAVRMAQSGAEE